MIESLLELDRELILYINNAGNIRWDQFMLFMSEKWVWLPMYIGILSIILRQFEQDSWIPLVMIVVLITLADQATSSILKPYFSRLRPCRDEELAELIRLAGKCGGKYGFASSHAANTMGLAIFISFFSTRRVGYLLVAWSLTIGFSRVYLGVHYPGDVMAGFIIGAFIAFVLFRLMLLASPAVAERISR